MLAVYSARFVTENSVVFNITSVLGRLVKQTGNT